MKKPGFNDTFFLQGPLSVRTMSECILFVRTMFAGSAAGNDHKKSLEHPPTFNHWGSGAVLQWKRLGSPGAFECCWEKLGASTSMRHLEKAPFWGMGNDDK